MESTFTMTLSKTMNAPLEVVWNAWSDAALVKQWWGPEGFTAPVAEIDFRETGVSLVCMRSPEGFEIYNTWTYKKILPMYCIEFIQHFVDKDRGKLNPADIGLPPGIPYEVPHTIIFKDLGNEQTEIHITEYGYTSAETAEMSKAGMTSVLDKLARTLKQEYNEPANSVIRKSIEVGASPTKLWQILTEPKHMQQWLGGAQVSSAWKEGAPIHFAGSWKGTDYADKGIILQYDPEKNFQYSYWSGFSGLPDEAKNYSVVRFDLKLLANTKTRFTLTHRNLATRQMYEHSEVNWTETLSQIKKLAEK